MNNQEELEYFRNKLKEIMGKGLPKKYLEATDLGEFYRISSIEHRFKERIKGLTDVEGIKEIIESYENRRTN
jgi:hypothetical protein